MVRLRPGHRSLLEFTASVTEGEGEEKWSFDCKEDFYLIVPDIISC